MNAAPFVCGQRGFEPRVLKLIHDDVDRAFCVPYRVEDGGDALVGSVISDSCPLVAQAAPATGRRRHRPQRPCLGRPRTRRRKRRVRNGKSDSMRERLPQTDSRTGRSVSWITALV